jgi:hypothetical protein
VDPGSIPGISTKRIFMFDNWQWVYLWGIAVALNYLFWITKSLFDGDDKVSTWRDSERGNTVGDDR